MKWGRFARGSYAAFNGRLTLEQERYAGEIGDWVLVVDDYAAYFRTKREAQAFAEALMSLAERRVVNV